ncbi:uncharacterized protein F5891DRAFT_1055220, partial [Suillus fuscotomentosus]
ETVLPSPEISYHPAQKMRLSLLAVVVALTASMFVSACKTENQICTSRLDCCDSMLCVHTQPDVSMRKSLCSQDSTT